MTAAQLKAAALAEIAKIKNDAVAEYLKLKVEHFSLTVVSVVGGVGLVVGFIVAKLF
jgi:hypothetical protein